MSTKWEQVGQVPVDAGCIIISDPCYILPDKSRGDSHGLDYKNVMGDSDKDGFYEQAVHDNIADSGAVLVQRFGGDGTYPVYAQKDRAGNVTAVMVVFDDREIPY